VDPLAEIDDLTAFEGRWPGTDAERRAARHLAARLRDLGREADLEATSVHPRYPLTHLIHALLAIGGGLLATAASQAAQLAGTIVVLLAALSAFGDLTGSFHLIRRLTGRRASQNVVSREDHGNPGTLVLVAHYDAARTGAVFNGRALRRRARVGNALHRTIGPFEPFFWSIMAVLVCCALRLLNIDGTAVSVVQFAATTVLIVAVPLLADIALSAVVPGASDNASGVATALRLADRYGERLDSFDVWVLLTGAQECMQLGMAAFLKRHGRELPQESTVFVCVDDVGSGTVRYATREGYILTQRYHPDLIALCDQIRDEDAEDGRYGAKPVVSRIATDANRARTRGYPAIAIGCANELDFPSHYHQPTDTPANVDPGSLERAYEFCSELIELIDETIGPRLDSPAERATR
jgi:hypothetical protein